MKFVGHAQRRAAQSRAPYGARGLKWTHFPDAHGGVRGRAPYGARGLKLTIPVVAVTIPVVAPRMGRVD